MRGHKGRFCVSYVPFENRRVDTTSASGKLVLHVFGVQRHRLWVQRHRSATSKDQRHRSATLKLEATSQSANHLSQHNKNLIYGLRKAPSKPSSSFGASMSRKFTSTVALHFGAIAHFERRLISERAKDGLATARKHGRNPSRPSLQQETVSTLQPRFSSLSLIPASFCRCFHAISIR